MAPNDPAGEGLLPAGSLERFAHDYVMSAQLLEKLTLSPPPAVVLEGLSALRIPQPGRPAELRVSTDKTKTPGAGALRPLGEHRLQRRGGGERGGEGRHLNTCSRMRRESSSSSATAASRSRAYMQWM